jgi:hypothetical protein
MSKRKRKLDRARTRREPSAPQKASALQNASAQAKSPPSEDPTPAQAEPSGLREYAYVVGDLKRVTILAAAMFALLIALSFFIG